MFRDFLIRVFCGWIVFSRLGLVFFRGYFFFLGFLIISVKFVGYIFYLLFYNELILWFN